MNVLKSLIKILRNNYSDISKNVLYRIKTNWFIYYFDVFDIAINENIIWKTLYHFD